MKIYNLGRQHSFQLTPYASFGALGTWSEGALCPECGRATDIRIPPLLVEWIPGCDEIGDFSWGCLISCVVQHRVYRFLKDRGFECRFEKVEYVEPEEKLRRGERRVPSPYSGPRLRWLRAETVLRFNMEKTGVEFEKKCMACGHSRYSKICNDIVIDGNRWNGEKMFCTEPTGTRDRMYVTEEGRTLIEEAGFTNIAFEECGYIDV